MDLNSQNLSGTESLIEDLSDEQLAACVGGCDIQVTAGGNNIAQVPLFELPLLGETIVNISSLGTSLRVYYDPNGSQRYRSDRNVKEAVVEADVHSILRGIASLPITTWKYKDQGETIRHIGPMAQDFAATFNVGESDRTINAVDANGVALAAIQALYQVIQQQESQINELQTQLHQLKQQIIQ
ncbi:MAG: tail fiber domain-containing protein [Aulosira sp. DedQUE10]|nr:tail fiber domain-containing protein [Aulosira sp. DedQUE10]